jgi:hypothetical protein
MGSHGRCLEGNLGVAGCVPFSVFCSSFRGRVIELLKHIIVKAT